MTLPASGPISLLANIRTELGLSGPLNLEDSAVRSLLGIASGPINLEAGYGKSSAIRPTSYTWATGVIGETITNPANAYDASVATYAEAKAALSGTDQWASDSEADITYAFTGSSTVTGKIYITLSFYEVSSVSDQGNSGLLYSTNGGAGWNYITVLGGSVYSETTFISPQLNNVKLSDIRVRVQLITPGSNDDYNDDTIDVKIYDINIH